MWMKRSSSRKASPLCQAACVGVALSVAFAGACTSSTPDEGDGESQGLHAAGSEVRDLGVHWYEMELTPETAEIRVRLLDSDKHEVGTYALESAAYGTFTATLQSEARTGTIGAEKSLKEFPDGAKGTLVRVFDEQGEFTVETKTLGERIGMAFIDGEQRIDVLRLDEDLHDPDNGSSSRLQAAVQLDNVRRIDADSRLVLLGAISNDLGLSEAYTAQVEADAHDQGEKGELQQGIHGTPLCGAILGTAGGACITCIVTAVTAGTITAGAGTAVIGFLCGFACGFGAADLIACSWASVFAPTQADCQLEAANDYPWTDGTADTTADICVFTCNNGKCDNYCGATYDGATGTCIAGNVCQCSNPES